MCIRDRDTIGSLLGGRDHSTIIQGIKKVTEEYEKNETTRNMIETIKKKIDVYKRQDNTDISLTSWEKYISDRI